MPSCFCGDVGAGSPESGGSALCVSDPLLGGRRGRTVLREDDVQCPWFDLYREVTSAKPLSVYLAGRLPFGKVEFELRQLLGLDGSRGRVPPSAREAKEAQERRGRRPAHVEADVKKAVVRPCVGADPEAPSVGRAVLYGKDEFPELSRR